MLYFVCTYCTYNNVIFYILYVLIARTIGPSLTVPVIKGKGGKACVLNSQNNAIFSVEFVLIEKNQVRYRKIFHTEIKIEIEIEISYDKLKKNIIEKCLK